MKKKLTLKKLTIASMDESLMRSIRGGYEADTYGDKCTVYQCETNAPHCTGLTELCSNECPSFDTDCNGGTSNEGPIQCHTDAQCTVGHCTDGCPHSYNDPTCPTIPITSIGVPCTV